MTVQALLDRTLHHLLPAPCLGCGTPLPARPARFSLCAGCRRHLPGRRPGAACAGCGRDLPPGPRRQHCGRCLASPPPWAGLGIPWHYLPPADAVLRGFKYRRLGYLDHHLAGLLAERCAALLEPEVAAGAGVVAVPLHWRRRLLRGYDQAERLGRALAARLGAPLHPCLRRVRATAPQTSLPRPRRRGNLHGAFRCHRRPPERAILVDDVTTTGATLEAAARCLRAAGCRRVTALAVARTPEPGERPVSEA